MGKNVKYIALFSLPVLVCLNSLSGEHDSQSLSVKPSVTTLSVAEERATQMQMINQREASLPSSVETSLTESEDHHFVNPRAITKSTEVLKRYAIRVNADNMAAIQEWIKDNGGDVVKSSGDRLVAYVSPLAYSELAERFSVEGFVDTLVRASAVSATNTEFQYSTHTTSSKDILTYSNNVLPAGSTAVAVLDSGVANRSDLNLVASYNVVPPAHAEEYSDGFDASSWSGNSGISNWSGSWYEYQDDNSYNSGKIKRVAIADKGKNNFALQLQSDGRYVANDRRVPLQDAASATLTFKWRPGKSVSGQSASFWVEIYSPDTGWTAISTLARSGNDETVANLWRTVVLDITPYISSDTWISFSTADSADYITLIDDVSVQLSHPTSTELDGLGHGTHIAGIIGASHYTPNPNYRGLAPDTPIVSVRVLDSHGHGFVSDVVSGLEWVRNNASNYRIGVVNLSLGAGVTGPAADDPMVIAAEDAWNDGLVVVASAGNYGAYGHFTITSPGISPKVITVGAYDTTGNTVGVSSFSSRGPTLHDHVLKPDLVAPGRGVISTASEWSKINRLLPSQKVNCATAGCGRGYIALSGSSMSTALVSAAAALMRNQEAGLSPATIKGSTHALRH